MNTCRIFVSNHRYGLLLWLGLSMLAGQACAAESPDPAEVSIGERLFLESRFAQAWYANPGKADPVLEYTVTTTEPMRGPFAGQTISCRACHMVDEHAAARHGGMRSYADFAHRSLVPTREDNQYVTVRNSMSLVNISIPRDNATVFHFDGEFNTMLDLIIGTLTERNYGWLPTEKQIAFKHIADIIRSDDGKGALAREFGGSYRKILAGTAADIKVEFRLPTEYRLDVDRATDNEIVTAVAKLISAYVSDLGFSRNAQGEYNGSPFDRFLEMNHLPRKARKNETGAEYSQRLAMALARLKTPLLVSTKEGKFVSHQQAYQFGETELAGMKLFFRQGSASTRGGNCFACHQAPHFSDFGFHNTGLSQHEYDAAHGQGKFNQLKIPDLPTRQQYYDAYLPATSTHPNASGKFRHITDQDKPGFTDLGLWNVFANPDMPAPQNKLTRIICDQVKQHDRHDCRQESLLPFTLAAFKTPVLRDLGHSAPYMHSGKFTNLEEAIGFYVTSSSLAKAGKLRNVDPALRHINLTTDDIDPLVAFVKALNEDYE